MPQLGPNKCIGGSGTLSSCWPPACRLGAPSTKHSARSATHPVPALADSCNVWFLPALPIAHVCDTDPTVVCPIAHSQGAPWKASTPLICWRAIQACALTWMCWTAGVSVELG